MISFGTQRLDKETMKPVCQAARREGFILFDTALAYDNHALAGSVLQQIGIDAFSSVISKIHQPLLEQRNVSHWVDAILADFQADTIFAVLIHAPRHVDHGRVLSELQEEKKKGKIRKWGVSNYTIGHLERLRQLGLVPDIIQTEIHPYLQESVLSDYCRRQGIMLMGHTGFAAGKVFNDPVLQDIAESEECTPSQLVLRWACQRGIVPLVSTIKPERLEGILSFFHKALSDRTMTILARCEAGMRLCFNPAWSEFDLNMVG